ncbi:MAG: protein kinase [Myxococcota bacterium]
MTQKIGSFVLGDALGRGGMSQVFRAWHVGRKEQVALKVLTFEQAQRPSSLRALRREIRSMGRLDHQGIVRVLDVGEVSAESAAASKGMFPAGAPWFAMDLVDGRTLKHYEWVDCFSTLRRLVLDVCDALAHAHARDIIHRDLKPGNIIVSREELGSWGVTLLDFGIAHLLSDPHEEDIERRDHRITGTPKYMAPEQIVGDWRAQGAWTDLYQLGCVVWMLVTGKPPFAQRDMRELLTAHLRDPLPELDPRFELPRGFDGWLERMLRKDPGRRFQSAADAAWALARLGHTDSCVPAGVEEVLPVPVSWRRDSGRGGRRRPPASIPPSPGLFAHIQTPMIARERERDALWSALRDVTERKRPRCVALTGASGVGTSRLLSWLVTTAQEYGAATSLWAGHDRGPVALAGVQGMSAMLTRVTRAKGLSGELLRERVRRFAHRIGFQRSDDPELDAIAALLDPHDEVATGGVRFVDDEHRYRVLWRLLKRMSKKRPVVLAVDDAQWGEDLLRFVEHVLLERASEPVPLLVVLVMHESAASARVATVMRSIGQHPRSSLIDIPPLDTAAHERTLDAMLLLEPELRTRVAQVTAGHPRRAVQLLTHWVELGVLTETPRGWALSDPGAFVDVERALWSARVDACLARCSEHALRGDSPERRALWLAAALGRSVELQVWQRACALAHVAPDAELVEWLSAAGLVHAHLTGFSFADAELSELLEAQASEARALKDVHLALAEALLECAPDAFAQHAWHLERGGAIAEAQERLYLAAIREHERGRYELAERFLAKHRALDDERCPPAPAQERAMFALRYAQVAVASGLSERATQALKDAETIMGEADGALPSDVRAKHLFVTLRMAMWRGDCAGVVASWCAERAGVEDAGVATRFGCMRMVVLSSIELGRLEQARVFGAKCLELAQASESLFSLGFAHNDMALVSLELGDADGLDAHIHPALDAFDSIGSVSGMAACHFLLADAAMRRGDFEGAARRLETVHARLDELGGLYRFEYMCFSCVLALERDQHPIAGAMLEAAWRRQPSALSFRDALRLHALELAYHAHQERWEDMERPLEVVEDMLARHPCLPQASYRAVSIAARCAERSGAALIGDRLRAILRVRPQAPRAPHA